jgi:hypothetical protein
MRRVLLILAAVALVVAGACAEDSEVGTGIDPGQLGDGKGGPRLGEATTTLAPPPTTAPRPTAPPTTARTATTPRPTAPPTTASQVAIEIKIIESAPHFDPKLASVPRNSIVRWVNLDSKPRGVVASDNSFASGPIPPGGRWDYRATRPGTFDYQDPDRPFATGQLQVT